MKLARKRFITRLVLEAGDAITFVDPNSLKRYEPVVKGDVVEACFEYELEDCYPGKVIRVLADDSTYATIREQDNAEEEIYFFDSTDYYKPR